MRVGCLAILAADLLLTLSAAQAGPSFSCNGRLNETEAVICSDDELSNLDQRLHELYVRNRYTPITEMQGKWLRERDACRFDKDCIRAAYNRRLDEMASAARSPQNGRHEPIEEVTMLGHNGSTIRMTTTGNAVIMSYSGVRPGLPISEGDVLFTGSNHPSGKIRGTAYTYKRGCGPAPYEVSGEQTNTRIVLRGPAPVRDADSCDILTYDPSNSNSRLEFTISK